MPIWITEVGFNTSYSDKPGYVGSNNETAKGTSLRDTFNLFLAELSPRRPIFYYTMHENSSYTPGFGLTRKLLNGDGSISAQRLAALDYYKDMSHAGSGPTIPNAPVQNTATFGDGTATLSWNSVPGATGYKVKYGATSGNHPAVVTLGNVTGTTVTGLTNGTTYYLVVTATNSAGESAKSNERSGTPQSLPPGVVLDDNFNAGTVGAAPAGWMIANASNTSTTIAAFPSSSDKSLKMTDTNTSAATTATRTFTAQSVPLQMEWDFNETNTTTYTKYYLRSGSTSAVEIVTTDLSGTPNQLVYIDAAGVKQPLATVNPNTWYHAKLIANPAVDSFDFFLDGVLKAGDLPVKAAVTSVNTVYLASANFASYSAHVDNLKITTGSQLTPPVPVQEDTQVASGSVTVTWQPVANAAGYEVHYGTSSGSHPTIFDAGATNSKTITGLTNGTTYYFVVKAYNVAGTSAASNERTGLPVNPVITLVNDTINSMTTGSLPTGWIVSSASNTGTTVAALPSGSDKSMKLVDNSSSGFTQTERTFPAQLGTISVEWKLHENNTNKFTKYYIISGTGINPIRLTTVLNGSTNQLCYYDPSDALVTIQAVNANTWYTVKVAANPVEDSFDVYVDGVLKISGAPFRSPAASLDRLFIQTGNSYTGSSVHVDNVKVIAEAP